MCRASIAGENYVRIFHAVDFGDRDVLARSACAIDGFRQDQLVRT